MNGSHTLDRNILTTFSDAAKLVLFNNGVCDTIADDKYSNLSVLQYQSLRLMARLATDGRVRKEIHENPQHKALLNRLQAMCKHPQPEFQKMAKEAFDMVSFIYEQDYQDTPQAEDLALIRNKTPVIDHELISIYILFHQPTFVELFRSLSTNTHSQGMGVEGLADDDDEEEEDEEEVTGIFFAVPCLFLVSVKAVGQLS